ncbi:MAG: HlyD family efflux transporter periplasmic adaptor subunit [Myxococcales bacterium]
MDQRKRRRLLGRLITGSVLLLAAVLISLGFVPKPIAVVLGKVERRELEVTVDESGKTRIKSRYVVSAPVVGNLGRISLKPGDEVVEGAVLAEISPVAPGLLDQRTRSESVARAAMSEANLERARVSIKRAEAALGFARDEASRLRTLHASQGTSKQALDQSEFQLRAAEEDYAAAQFGERVAENELNMARAAIASMSGNNKNASAALTLNAPISGRVLRVYQESEAVVQPGMPLIEVGDPSKLEVVVDVLSTEAVKIEPGTAARIERWGGDKPIAARVRRKEPSAFTTRSALGVEEQRVPVVLDLVDPYETWTALSDGYRVEARIRTALISDALVVPASATFRDGNTWAVYKVEAGKAEKAPLELGARTPDWVQVKQGVTEKAAVILYPSDQVSEGVDIDPS